MGKDSAERILTIRELNRALLARQLLLERSNLPLSRALERVAGLQTQYAPAGYISLWSRVEGFERDQLTMALERRRVIQGTLLRATIHMVSASDYPIFVAGIQRFRQEWWQRVQTKALEGVDMKKAASLLRRRLREGPRRQAELVEMLSAEGFPRVAWSGAGLWLDLVRVPPSGTWERRRADLYALADQWLPRQRRVTEAQGLRHLVLRYLGGFGPARLNDVANWAGVPVGVLRPVAEKMKLRHFRDEDGGDLVDLPRTRLPDPDTPAPVRFLPTWEATLLAHARRAEILPEGYRRRVFNTKMPQSVNTFLVDGQVAGTWRYEAGRVRTEAFHSLPRSVRRELEDEAEALATFHAS